ncbi:MAG: hypothetical protein ABUS48_02860 [Pseudomonadota bacterium]
MSGRTLVGVTHHRPDYFPMRASSAAFGALGAMAEVSAGKTFPETHNLTDPASRIEDHIIARLNANGTNTIGDHLDMSAAKANTPYPIAANTIYVDAQSTGWAESYFPMNWGKFRLSYGTLIRVIDGSNGHVLAQQTCGQASDPSADKSPSLAELDADNSALRNSMFAQMADACESRFETSTLAALAPH